jgi:predicted nucleic acid-binding protein
LIFLDASALLASEDVLDAHYDDARRLLLSEQPFATLDLAIYEVTNTADGRWRKPSHAQRLRERIWAIERDGGLIRIDEVLIEAAAALVREHGLSSYDATYAAAAQALGVPLASCDVRDLVSRGLAHLPGDLLP